jgi:multiple sugar transport system ATP-binding protein
MADVVLEGVSKFFPPTPAQHLGGDGPIAAVNQLNLSIGDGELVVLVGPSGSGKTTVLRLIAGLESPDEGVIRLGGRVVNDSPPSERNIAMVFQSYALYSHLSVYNNLAFGMKGSWSKTLFRRGRTANESEDKTEKTQGSNIRERVRQTAQMLGIEGLLDRSPAQLSGGERQRVAVGRALVRTPQAFLLDEPLSNLDAPLRVELRRKIKELHRRRGTAMLYVTHDQVEALALGDRVGVIDRGELQQIGAPAEIYQQPKNRFVAGFLGSAGMNFLEGRFISVEGGIQFQCPGVTYPLLPDSPSEYAGRPVILGIRPEDVLLREPGSAEFKTDASARARVSLVEYSGDATLIHLDLEDRQASQSGKGTSGAIDHLKLICKAEARTTARPGDLRELAFRRSRVHWFDGETGERLDAISSATAPSA